MAPALNLFVRCLAIILCSLPHALPFSSVPRPPLVLREGKTCTIASIVHIRHTSRYARLNMRRTTMTSTAEPTAAEARAIALEDWMGASCGWKPDGLVQIREIEGKGCGAISSQEIREGERALQVPLAACLVANSAQGVGGKGGRLEKEVKTAVEGGGEMSALAARLMAERIEGEEGFFWPLINSLPSSVEASSVLYWTDEEVELLKGTEAYESSVVMRQEVDQGIERMVQAFSPAVSSSSVREQARWAYAVVLGYAMVLQNQDCVAVVPFLSYLNHDPLCTARFQDDVHSVFCAADRSYGADEEVVVNYGHKSNSDLLTSYGFVLPDNPHATMQVRLPLDASDPLLAEKKQALAEAGLVPDAPFLLSPSAPPPPPLLAALRFLAISDKATVRKEAQSSGRLLQGLRLRSALPSPSLSPTNDRRAYALLASACEAAAAALASSDEVEAAAGARAPSARRATLELFLGEERRGLELVRAEAAARAEAKGKAKKKKKR